MPPHESNQPSRSTGTIYTGHDVVDVHDVRIGRVVDVLYDDVQIGDLDGSITGEALGGVGREPTWLVVDPGMLRSAHYLPVAGSYRAEDGAIVTPWDKNWVKSAPKASGDHVLTRAERDALTAHYELAG